MKLGDKVRFINSTFYHGGHITSLDPLTVTSFEGQEVKTRLSNIEPYEPLQFITSRGKHNKGNRKQLSNEQENK